MGHLLKEYYSYGVCLVFVWCLFDSKTLCLTGKSRIHADKKEIPTPITKEGRRTDRSSPQSYQCKLNRAYCKHLQLSVLIILNKSVLSVSSEYLNDGRWMLNCAVIIIIHSSCCMLSRFRL